MEATPAGFTKPLRQSCSPHPQVVKVALPGAATVVVVESSEDLASARAEHPGGVVLSARELRELERHRSRPDLIRAVLQVKRAFDAQIIPRAAALGEWCEQREAIPAEQLLGLEKENDSHE
jgi:hypothetical protein